MIRIKLKYPNRNIESHLISNSVVLGTNVSISRNVEVFDDVIIDDYSYVNAGTLIASAKIGKYCSIGYFCQIGVPEHPINYISSSPFTYGKNNVFGIPQFYNDYQSPPIIGNDVWIGSHSVILQGVEIGNGAIVAAGAVVTKDVPPYTIVGGIPAKVIRKRFSDEQINYLQNLKWWDCSIEELKRLEDLFLLKDNWVSEINRKNSIKE